MSKTMEEIKEDFLNELNKTNELILSAYKNAVDRLHNDKQELQEQNGELVEMLEKSLGALNDCCMVIDSQDEVFEHVKTLSSDINKALFNYRPKINNNHGFKNKH